MNNIDLRNFTKKEINYLSDKFSGISKKGDKLKFTNYFMEINGEPFLGISGECHFSRVHENQWEDTILKMKTGGINVVSTYIFWNHHEEIESKFRFDGNRNLRKFVEICGKHGLYVIVRIGPFDHGEVRNGGLPDWIYGKPFEARSLNSGFLKATRILYKEIGKQLDGLYFSNNGPIIGTQIENEYMHSAAPWEMTTGVSNEWVPGGNDGNEYMIKLKEIAQEEGIITPFYTCTGWGGAASPVDEMLPLWGGYAFWPWIFYDYDGDHPVTPEYIYRDNHNNSVPKTYNFEPEYGPENIPYACCEMGGGMSCYYNYRFRLPFESIDAMANIKLGSGCNFLGYYMYRGGSNPRGEVTPYLNEHQCPKISYDYQAAIGEFGQLRPSYFRLKALHTFTQNFKELCHMKTVLPENANDIDPSDTKTLRYSVRTDGNSGFVFINNYQDHIECEDKHNEKITLKLENEEILIDNINISAGEEAILPFNLDVGGYRLISAKAQPLSIIDGDLKTYFFFTPKGMEKEYNWDTKDIHSIDNENNNSFIIGGVHGKVRVVTLTREESAMYYEIERNNRKFAILSSLPPLYNGEDIRFEISSREKEFEFLTLPAMDFDISCNSEPIKRDIWSGISCKYDINMENVEFKEIFSSKYVVNLKPCHKYKNIIMEIDYMGDIGNAFADGQLISDNFSNGETWEIGLEQTMDLSRENEIVFAITPIKKDVKVDVSSTMAGRMENNGDSLAKLSDVRLVAVDDIVLSFI
ncbi:MAG: beta-galactosidase [Lachnospirales bacterium]